MGKKKLEFKVESLSRFLVYVLGHRPDEFGLVPDAEGFFRIKELLQALHEESGWHYVRKSHVNEVLMSENRHLFHAEENRIRALENNWRLELKNPAIGLSGLLYMGIRKRAHPVVMEKGIRSVSGRYHVLSSDRDRALRMGKRLDPEPVILEIPARRKGKARPLLYPFGVLFLCHEISADMIAGPPVSKADQERLREQEAQKETAPQKPVDPSPGSFLLEHGRDPLQPKKGKGKKPKGWKETARKSKNKGFKDSRGQGFE